LLRRFKLLALLLALVLAFGCAAASAEAVAPAAPAAAPEGYIPVGENSRFTLLLKQETMALIIQSKATGEMLYTTVQDANTGNATWKGFYQSGVVIEYLEDVKDKPIQADFINNPNTITYDFGENAFTAHITYTELGISFDVQVSLDEDGIHVHLPSDSIVETKDETSLVMLDENGREVTVATAKYTKSAEESEFVLTTNDGAAYKLNKSYYVSGKAAEVTVKDSAGTNQVTLPLTKELAAPFTVYATDAAGKAVELDAAAVASVRQDLFITATAKDGSAIRIPKERFVSVSEYSYTISSVYLYPFMGHSVAGEGQGYMLIPDGQGALIGFEDNEGRYSSPYDKQVYGMNIGVEDQLSSDTRVPAEDVLAPFYGMVHTDKQLAVLGVVEEGDVGARIQAYPNGVRNLPFDWATAKFTYRFVFNQPMGPSAGAVATRNAHRRQFDLTQHFLLEEGESATYAGLAVAYRDYLTRKGTFQKAEQRPFDIRVEFLGVERENYILGKQDVVMTTFAQAEEMLELLKADGVENISAAYRGWQTDGLTGGVPTTGCDPARSLGGTKGLAQLKAAADEMGVELSLEADVLSLNTETHPTLTFSALKKITSQTWSKPTYGMVYDTLHYLNPVSSRDVAKKLIGQVKDAGIEGISFTGITQLLADYYHKDAYHDSSEMAAIYTEIIAGAGEEMNVSLVRPNAYLWPLADALTDLPIAGSDYNYTDAEVPFLTIALSGQVPYYVEYANFQANTNEFFLHLMEQGARPSFLLTWEDPIKLQNSNSSDIYSSRFELYQALIARWYSELNALYETVGPDAVITDHVRVGDVVKVTWSEGTQVYLNFGDKPAAMDGITLEKLEHKVVSGNGN